jgi:hypothetical protein
MGSTAPTTATAAAAGTTSYPPPTPTHNAGYVEIENGIHQRKFACKPLLPSSTLLQPARLVALKLASTSTKSN